MNKYHFQPLFQLELRIILRPEYTQDHVLIENPFASTRNHFKVVPYEKIESFRGFVDFSEVSYDHLVFSG